MIIDSPCFICGRQATLFITVGGRPIVLCQMHAHELWRELRDTSASQREVYHAKS